MTGPSGQDDWPRLAPLGLDGWLVRFADALDEPANRAALALRAAIEAHAWPGVEETSSALTSTYLRFDPLHPEAAALEPRLRALLACTDWTKAPPPEGRRLWRIPTVWGGPLAPQLAEAAAMVGVSEAAARDALSTARTRVLALGMKAGQPYLGQLPPLWDIPRQSGLTPLVPQGALVLAIRQFVLFAGPSPTGWRHVGQNAFAAFRPDSDTPFALRPGDEVLFPAITEAQLDAIRARCPDGSGGAITQALA